MADYIEKYCASSEDSNTHSNDSDCECTDCYDPIRYSYLVYDDVQEMYDEAQADNQHIKKDSGNWLTAKNLVKASYENTNNTEFFLDVLANHMRENEDDFSEIKEVLLETETTIHCFGSEIGKYIVENIKIPAYKSKSYFSGISGFDDSVNQWGWKIVVVTTKSMYCANRLMSESQMGCF